MTGTTIIAGRREGPQQARSYPHGSFYELHRIFREEYGLSGAESVAMARAIIEDDLAAERAAPVEASQHDHWGDVFPVLGEPTEAELLPDPEGLAVTLERGEKAARKSRKKPVQLPDYGGAFPEAEAHVQTKGFWPKPLEDTRNDRRKRAKRSGFLAALEDLHAFACGELEWGKLWLPDLNGQPLYSKATLEHARLAVARHLRSVDETACVWKLERGRGGRFHVEMVVPAGSSRGLHAAKPVTNLKGLADYLCKPADAWACEPDKNAKRVWSAEELERGKVAACEEFLTRDRGPSGGERLQFWGSMGLGKGKR